MSSKINILEKTLVEDFRNLFYTFNTIFLPFRQKGIDIFIYKKQQQIKVDFSNMDFDCLYFLSDSLPIIY